MAGCHWVKGTQPTCPVGVIVIREALLNQFSLNYKFLITSGSGSQYVLPVLAYGNTNTFTNTTWYSLPPK